MTKEEKEKAIKCLKWFKEYNEEDYCGGDRIKNEHDDWFYRVTERDFEVFDMIIGWLEQEPCSGEWLPKPEERFIYAQCSKCGEIHNIPHNYCPSCGRIMDRNGFEAYIKAESEEV